MFSMVRRSRPGWAFSRRLSSLGSAAWVTRNLSRTLIGGGTAGAALAPQAQGPFLVQAASLGDQDKAQAEADRLQKFGWEAAVRGAGKAGGGMTFRVQIGYFATREDAQAFIDQNKAKLPGAIPAHR